MINKAILIGRLGKDPEVKHLESGAVVANFNIATDEYFKDASGNFQERTEWHRIVAWRWLAEKAERSLQKGRLVYVEGKIRTRQWEDSDGNKKYTTEVEAENIRLLDRKDDGTEGAPASSSQTPENTDVKVEDEPTDDLPF